MNESLRHLYQEVILDHNKNPRNARKMPMCDCRAEGFNPLCGDQLTLYLKVEDEIIVDASFEGSGCAISTASASLLTEIVKGKCKEEAERLFHAVHGLLTQDFEVKQDDLGKLVVLEGVKSYPTRVKCATLAWHTLLAALKEQRQAVSTE